LVSEQITDYLSNLKIKIIPSWMIKMCSYFYSQ
jgi:hypothetical protein